MSNPLEGLPLVAKPNTGGPEPPGFYCAHPKKKFLFGPRNNNYVWWWVCWCDTAGCPEWRRAYIAYDQEMKREG